MKTGGRFTVGRNSEDNGESVQHRSLQQFTRLGGMNTPPMILLVFLETIANDKEERFLVVRFMVAFSFFKLEGHEEAKRRASPGDMTY